MVEREEKKKGEEEFCLIVTEISTKDDVLQYDCCTTPDFLIVWNTGFCIRKAVSRPHVLFHKEEQ